MKLINEKTGVVLTIIGIILLIASVIIFPYKHIVFDFTETINSEKFGHFGDFVGGLIGSIFSLVGVILFYVALKHQREELSANREILILEHKTLNLQLEEFQNQRQELEETRKVFNLQLENQNIQRFENTFFSLIKNTTDILNNTGIDSLHTFLDSSINNYLLGKITTKNREFESEFKNLKSNREIYSFDKTDILKDNTIKALNDFLKLPRFSFYTTYLKSTEILFEYVISSHLISLKARNFYLKTYFASLPLALKLIIGYYLIKKTNKNTIKKTYFKHIKITDFIENNAFRDSPFQILLFEKEINAVDPKIKIDESIYYLPYEVTKPNF